VTFDVAAEAYDRFMGRFSAPLATTFAPLLGLDAATSALDVGCGPGALTAVLADRIGPSAVAAVDPSTSFVAAARERCPGVDVREATAERLPFDDGTFDVVAAQLVVHFLAHPVAGIREMGRVARAGGRVAACVWDHAGDGGPLASFWRAARALDPRAPGESSLPGTREGHLHELFTAAGLSHVESGRLAVTVGFPSVAAWWEPFTLGVGPAGAYVAGLDDAHREELRRRCAAELPPAPFEVEAVAWHAVGRA
jgi:SAM-dependent methyltransferase